MKDKSKKLKCLLLQFWFGALGLMAVDRAYAAVEILHVWYWIGLIVNSSGKEIGIIPLLPLGMGWEWTGRDRMRLYPYCTQSGQLISRLMKLLEISSHLNQSCVVINCTVEDRWWPVNFICLLKTGKFYVIV